MAILHRAGTSEITLTATGNVLVLLGGLATGVISARVLGAQGRGEFLAVFTWSSVLGLVLSGAASHSLVTYARRGLPSAQIQRFVWRHLALTFGVGAAIAGVGWAGGFVTWLTAADAGGAVLFMVSTVAVADLSGVALGYGDVRIGLQRVRLLPIAAGILAMVVLTTLGNRSPGVWLFVVSLAQVAPSVISLVRLSPNPAAPIPGIERVMLLRIARTAGRFYVAGIAAQVNYRLDLLVVSLVLSQAAVANYGVAVAAGAAVASIGQAIGTVHFGRFASPDACYDAIHAVRRAARMAAFFSAAVALPVAVASPVLVDVLFGDAYQEAVTPTMVLVLAAIPTSVDFLLIHAFLGLQQLLNQLYAVLGFTSVLTVVGVIWAAEVTADLTTVALVSPVVYLCSVFLLLWLSRRFTNERPLTDGVSVAVSPEPHGGTIVTEPIA